MSCDDRLDVTMSGVTRSVERLDVTMSGVTRSVE